MSGSNCVVIGQPVDYRRGSGTDDHAALDVLGQDADETPVALLGELDQYLAELAYLRALLLAGDGTRLEHLFDEARRARNAWAEQQTNPVSE